MDIVLKSGKCSHSAHLICSKHRQIQLKFVNHRSMEGAWKTEPLITFCATTDTKILCSLSSCTEYFDAAMTDAFQRNRSSVRILDAGAGRGRTASYLRSLGYNNIDALTVSKERLDNAERSGLYRNLLFTALKAESTLCATGAFDAVICADGVFPDEVDPDALDEMLRLVKPGKVGNFILRKTSIF